MDNRRELESIGVNEQTIKPGDRLVVTGSPSRRGANQMYIERLQRPADGFGFEQDQKQPAPTGFGFAIRRPNRPAGSGGRSRPPPMRFISA